MCLCYNYIACTVMKFLLSKKKRIHNRMMKFISRKKNYKTVHSRILRIDLLLSVPIVFSKQNRNFHCLVHIKYFK